MPRNSVDLLDLVLLEAHKQLTVATTSMCLYQQVKEAWGSRPPERGS